MCERCNRDVTDNDEQAHVVLDDGGKLVGCISNALVVRDRNATIRPAVLQPFFVRTVRLEEIVVALNN